MQNILLELTVIPSQRILDFSIPRAYRDPWFYGVTYGMGQATQGPIVAVLAGSSSPEPGICCNTHPAQSGPPHALCRHAQSPSPAVDRADHRTCNPRKSRILFDNGRPCAKEREAQRAGLRTAMAGLMHGVQGLAPPRKWHVNDAWKWLDVKKFRYSTVQYFFFDF